MIIECLKNMQSSLKKGTWIVTKEVPGNCVSDNVIGRFDPNYTYIKHVNMILGTVGSM